MAIALIAAFCLGLVFTAIWVRETIRQQDAERAAIATPTSYPVPAACNPQDIDVSVTAPSQTPAGAGVTAALTLRNNGGQACLLDVGGANLGLVVSSGSATLLNSAMCTSNPANHKLLVDAGDSASVSLWWDGTVASSSCVSAAGAAASPAATPSPSVQEEQTQQDAAQADPQAADQSAEGGEAQAEQTPAEGGGEAAATAQASDPASQEAATPSASAQATEPASHQPTALSVSGGGSYATAGTYQLRLQLAGQDLGPQLLLVIT